MFVTSDIFDLKQIGEDTDFPWREILVAGVAVHGPQWPGYRSGARFLYEAGRCCDLLEGLVVADYRFITDRRRGIAPIFEPLARGEIVEPAEDPFKVELRISQPVEADGFFGIRVGGEVSSVVRLEDRLSGSPSAVNDRSQPLEADFIFLENERSLEHACRLFKLSIDILDAEYGYYFIRDQRCFPEGYSRGIVTMLDEGVLAHENADECSRWDDFQREDLWSAPWPLFRDIYQMNLVSERHTSTLIDGLGYLTDWISAEPGRGQLDDLGKGRLLWILTDAEMVNVRPRLNRAGLLLSCPDRIYRDLPGGASNVEKL